MKRPSFQFYPSDWRKDAALQSCSLAAQGLWMNVLCIAHECSSYGRLILNGTPMSVDRLARLVGGDVALVASLLAELEEAGVSSVDDEGAIYSRRMVRDEEVRNRRARGGASGGAYGHLGASHGAKGGRPRKVTAGQSGVSAGSDTGVSSSIGRGVSEPPFDPPPSSSSSSSSSSSGNTHTVSLEALAAGAQSTVDASAVVQGHEPTPAGRVCRLIRLAGIPDVNPGHPLLLELLQAGATDAEFVGACKVARERGKGFAYVLGTVAGQRAEAAKAAAAGITGPGPVVVRGVFDERHQRRLQGAAALVGSAPMGWPETPEEMAEMLRQAHEHEERKHAAVA